MATEGIEAVFVETRNWGKAAKFFQALGFELEFATDHASGQLRNGDGPYVFIAEVPGDSEPGVRLVLKVPDADAFRPDPALDVVTPFEDTHYGTREMTVRDPDGRLWSLQAPAAKTGIVTGAQTGKQITAPDSTAVRVALWRAMHVQVDPPPHVLQDEIGLRLAAPDDGWRDRGDMHPAGTSRYRAGIVARSRFTEDLVAEQAANGVTQYVILGAGLDTFAQRNPGLAARLRVFEVDQPGPQAWKHERLTELGYGIPPWLRLVPVDFEADGSWWDRLAAAGFDAAEPAVVASLGVSMYLTKDANAATLRQLATLAPGSTLIMTFAPPLDLLDEQDRAARLVAEHGARTSGTPWLSSFAPPEILALARHAGFKHASYLSAAMLNDRYFAARTDDLRTSPGEELLVATA